jgi:hypothetical protein
MALLLDVETGVEFLNVGTVDAIARDVGETPMVPLHAGPVVPTVANEHIVVVFVEATNVHRNKVIRPFRWKRERRKWERQNELVSVGRMA